MSVLSLPRNARRRLAVLGIAAIALGSCSSLPGSGWFSSSSRVAYNDTKWCVPSKLKRVVERVADRFGPVTVTSTNRWWLENWWKGGASSSYHLDCEAVDFVVRGNPKEVVAFLKSQPAVGGYKYYRSGHYHIDVGPRRTW
ncbi:YcbK family protein [Coralliovum pocilloporae]|uniref:YcbK family protein n=1 Tax=Coralliovum pocilloporae TaxID=3066369 RepID=UPI003307459E